MLEPHSAACHAYPSCTFIDDEAVLTYYEMDESVSFDFDGPRSLKLARLPLARIEQQTPGT